MALQHQTIGSSRPIAPKKVSFVLPGRRTLSEHLPAEIVDVPITVAQCSRYLRKAIEQQALDDPAKAQIRLSGIDSMGFGMYVEWLKSGQVEYHSPPSSSTSGGLLLRDSFDLIFAHIVGSQLDERDFQDYIIDMLARSLDPSQTPNLKVLEVVFLERGASNVLKQFVVDRMFAIERKMLGMMRGSDDDVGNAVECEYHVHEAGACYKINVSSRLFANGDDIANKLYETCGSNAESLPTGGQELRCSSTSHLTTCTSTDPTPHNMMEISYFGSSDCSREVHGLKQQVPMLNLRTNKPLPTIPPYTPGMSPTHPSSPKTLCFADLPNTESKVMSTQNIVRECLERLQRTYISKARTNYPSDSHHPDIPVLVLECLERFKKASAEVISTSSSASSHSNERSSPDGLNLLEEHKPESPCLRSLDSPSPRPASPELSFESLPKPLKLPTQTELPLLVNTHPLPSNSSQSLMFPPSCARTLSRKPIALHPNSSQLLTTRTPIVARKAAPFRGEDWLQQYDTINAMMNNTPAVMAKPSKKSYVKELLRSDSISSRFELLRSDSVLSRFGLEGSVLIPRHDSQGL
jgi:hypothetical protein